MDDMASASGKKSLVLNKIKKLDYARNEAYKSLRTNVRFCGNDIKAILMTSCLPNEGKSTVSFNLAKSLADDGKKVLFLDADLRKSVLIGRLGATEDNRGQILGLSHYLTGQNTLEEVLYETNVEHLHIIFSGPEVPNPTELLGNEYLNSLMEYARSCFDYVIVDAPPLGAVVDAAILTKNCDGVVIIIENNMVSRRMAQTIKKQLMQTGARILGVVLNKVDVKKGSYYQGYYHGYGYYRKAYKKYGDYGTYGEY